MIAFIGHRFRDGMLLTGVGPWRGACRVLKCGQRRTPTRRRAYHTNVGCTRASALGPASERTDHHVTNMRRWRGGVRTLALARAHTPP